LARGSCGSISHSLRDLQDAEESGLWWAFFDTRIGAWEQYRAALADRLSDDSWEHVTQSVYELTRFSESMRATPALSSGKTGKVTLGPESRKSVATMSSNATSAFNDLAKLSGGEVVELLHEGRQTPRIRQPPDPAQF
jgi:hypothetical protein